MAHNFIIDVPTTTKLHIRQAEVIPFLELKQLHVPAARYPYRNPEDEVEKALVKWSREREMPVHQLFMPGTSWHDVARGKKHEVLLANPRYSAAVFFVAGKNWNKLSGHPNGTEMFIIDDILYRRVTWRSIGDKTRKSAGMTTRVKSQDQFIYYLIRCKSSNNDPLRSTILAGLGEGVFREPELEEAL